MTKLTQFISLLSRRPSRRTKKRLIWLALLAVTFWPIPTVRRKADVVTIRNQNHLYIFVSETVIGGIATPLGAMVRWPLEHTITENLIFYDVYNGKSTHYVLHNVLFGSPQGYRGTLLFQCVAEDGHSYNDLLYGHNNHVQYFRWTGQGFLAVPEPENTQISAAIETRPDDGLTVPNGWLKVDYMQLMSKTPYNLPVYRIPLPVKDHAYVFVLRKQDLRTVPRPSVASYWEEYNLEGLDAPVDHELLYHWDNTTRITPWWTYLSL